MQVNHYPCSTNTNKYALLNHTDSSTSKRYYFPLHSNDDNTPAYHPSVMRVIYFRRFPLKAMRLRFAEPLFVFVKEKVEKLNRVLSILIRVRGRRTLNFLPEKATARIYAFSLLKQPAVHCAQQHNALEYTEQRFRLTNTIKAPVFNSA